MRKLLALSLAVSVLAGCGDDDTAAVDTTTTTAEVTPTEATEDEESTTTTAAEEIDGPTVTLEDPGQEPRRELRLDLAAGDTDQVTQRQEVSVEVTVDGQTQTAPSPTTELDLAYEVTSVEDDVIETRGTYQDVRIVDPAGSDPSTVSQIEELLGGFLDAEALATFTTQGAVVSSTIEGLDLEGGAGQMTQQLAASLADVAESLSMPFPEEAIGTGARWVVETETEIAGIRVAITTTVHLDELTDERAAGTVEQDIRFLPGEVEIFGTAATVVSGDLQGSGTVEWDLVDGIVPRSDITTSGLSVIEAQGATIEQDQRQRIVVTAR